MKPRSKKVGKLVQAKPPKLAPRSQTVSTVPAAESAASQYPIVGVGASAGGLEAFTQLIESLPTEPGIALVLVQHLDPTHESMLSDILARTTPLPVLQAEDGLTVQPNHVYVNPPNKNMAMLHGTLSLMPRPETASQYLPIDYFFRSLADDQQSHAVGVVLSGTGSDGTLGLRAIKAEGGLTFVQNKDSAKYDGMPSSAIAAGVADFVLSPDAMAAELARLAHHPYLLRAPAVPPSEAPGEDESDLSKILITLRMETGVDFSNYKPTTIRRRIGRRMALHKIGTYAVYLRFLNENANERHSLYQDLLINITDFFRDPGTFDALQRHVFPQLLQGRARETPVRLWVPGCSTGEEAYSLSMALLEFLGERARESYIQVFGTDISDPAIERARAGIYPESIAADVSPERLHRFFVKVEGGYQVSKALRALCVFSHQDITRDPPFSKLDLISCRNVLIYMGADLQKAILPTFHFALNPGGILVLGNSETIGPFADLFKLIDKKYKIYGKKSVAQPTTHSFAMTNHADKPYVARSRGSIALSGFDAQKAADRIALAKFAPAGVLVDGHLDIVEFRGYTGAYLEPAPGNASLNLLKMARPGLMPELRAALDQARQTSSTVRQAGVRFQAESGFREVTLEVIPIKPLPTSNDSHFLVLFETAAAVDPSQGTLTQSKTAKAKTSKTKRPRATLAEQQLKQVQLELTATKAYLESIIEQHEHTNEELTAALEEIQSSNEELQSTNEELETAKEELQSTNEELTTVNEELQNRNSELGVVNNDLVNLLTSVHIPVLILDSDLRIRRFTFPAEAAFGLIPADVGRPLGDLKLRLILPDLEALIVQVRETLEVREMEVKDREGHWYSLRLRPYQTVDHRIDGVVLVLIDIDQSKRRTEELREARDYAQAIIETVREPLVVLNGDLRVQVANHAFYQMFQVTPEETEGQLLYDLGDQQWNLPRLRELLEEILPQNAHLVDFQVEAEFPRIGHKRLVLNARRINRDSTPSQLILLAIDEACV